MKLTEHTISTKIGKFHFGWHPWGWIWGQFANPEKAKEIYDCNPHSGKHNFHGYWLGSPMKELRNHLEDMRQSNLIK